jgi:predicted transcriptional regulator
VAVIGRQLGLNAVISGNLINIRPLDELEGILWMKDVRYSLEVLISAQVYDTQTATKIIDESFTQEVEIDEIDHTEIKRTNAQNFPKLNEAYEKIVVDMGERICEAVSEENWVGYVTAVDGEKFIISAGGLVGLKKGTVLEVFDSGRILEGIDGQRFYSPGYKTAELEIVAISDNQAEAVKINGRGLKVGSVVRKK